IVFFNHSPSDDSYTFPTRRSSDLRWNADPLRGLGPRIRAGAGPGADRVASSRLPPSGGLDDPVRPARIRRMRRLGDLQLGDLPRSEEHTSELQSLRHLVCRLLLEK